MSVIIYHNPHCSKSRETLALLENKGIQPIIELYLQKQYSVNELQSIAKKLGIDDIRQMMRTKDELYKSLNLDNLDLSQAELFKAISEHSALIERPIVINGDKAKIGRPPETVLEIL
ncbi:TPA: arsenate reductase (glutaredoxin) [Haemophilus influenzae]|uniref:arsenate reductase (glutaredoxin) n=1 Tax=Haemophilus influenzae TaxID=727 RepID=UPI0008DBCDDD|nr:arsenate reductase (glutaredoxin) [Haemophilus influenzae]AOZ66812.1 arsenate reductase (glutaredoxin) [Haemophilus influenzae]MBD3608508.1 arsenate reductase (glutaredoxin) [Haemophilus influenzae]NKB85859.1 arsenate reductase (glutaredoxin) [Haemophilus influenzae]POP28802.1 arsenate reductase (glutaredoxin) [Haemophilus influenzae]RDT72805.1 arsenate reductase (glutaredoxin) [Haemophilus influenzae]